MKIKAILFLTFILLLPGQAATVAISALTATTAPSTNTYVEVADISAATKSTKLWINDLARIFGRKIFAENRAAMLQPPSATDTASLAGFGDSPTVNGAGASVVNGTSTEPIYLQVDSATSASSVASVVGHLHNDVGQNIDAEFYCKMSTTNITRFVVGMTVTQGSTMASSSNPAGDYAIFQFDSAAGDTTYKCVTKDGTTQSSRTDSTVAANANARRFRIVVTAGTNVKFYIDDALVATLTGNLPRSGQKWGFYVGACNLTDTTARSVYVGRVTYTESF